MHTCTHCGGVCDCDGSKRTEQPEDCVHTQVRQRAAARNAGLCPSCGAIPGGLHDEDCGKPRGDAAQPGSGEPAKET